MPLDLPSVIGNYLSLWIATAVVVFGLFIYGFVDLKRFSIRRAWAISGVCFDESIRRKVLWITPLAIAGAVIVAQLQNPVDAQDAIRQTIKFCLFATGLLVCVTAIILASTNLPKEIENRVIYTIVTKPTTRLEIVVGKVLGFARVSAAILIIMGLFTAVYLHLRAWGLRQEVVARLNSGDYDPLSRPTLEYYRDAGLLGARTFLRPADLQIFSRVPQPDEGKLWMFGGDGDQAFAVPFEILPEQLIPPGLPDAPPGATGLFIRLNVGFNVAEAVQKRMREKPDIPETIAAPDAPKPQLSADLRVELFDQDFNTLLSEPINNGQPVKLTDPSGTTPVLARISPEAAASLFAPGQRLLRLFVQASGETPGMEYFVSSSRSDSPVSLIVPGARIEQGRIVADSDSRKGQVIPALRDLDKPDQYSGPIFRGRVGTYGQQLRGGKPGEAPLAIYSFQRRPGDPAIRAINGRVPFEMKVGIERSGLDEDDATTNVELRFVNRATGKISEPILIQPENVRTSYFTVPADAVGDGNFDIHVRNLTPGNFIGMLTTSVSAVASEQSFNWNLLKSLLIMWLMAILVVIIAIFCSTFLSWPIAIVLTVVLLIGHWVVLQLGEDVGPGLGARIATEMKIENPGSAQSLARSVDALSKLLTTIAAFLPDISRFASVEDIERGVTISSRRLLDPLFVLLTFGLPMLVIAYIILRNKEVAP